MTATASGKHAEPVRAQPASPEVRGLTYQHDQGAQRLRLLSFNAQVGIPSSRLHHYLTNSWKHVLPYKGRIGNLDRVARFISDFDIVGVQELDGGSLRSNFVDLASYLSEKARFPHTYNRINRNLGQFAKHSLALFSRLEPERVEMHRLPGPLPGRGPSRPVTQWKMARSWCCFCCTWHSAGAHARPSWTTSPNGSSRNATPW